MLQGATEARVPRAAPGGRGGQTGSAAWCGAWRRRGRRRPLRRAAGVAGCGPPPYTGWAGRSGRPWTGGRPPARARVRAQPGKARDGALLTAIEAWRWTPRARMGSDCGARGPTTWMLRGSITQASREAARQATWPWPRRQRTKGRRRWRAGGRQCEKGRALGCLGRRRAAPGAPGLGARRRGRAVGRRCTPAAAPAVGATRAPWGRALMALPSTATAQWTHSLPGRPMGRPWPWLLAGCQLRGQAGPRRRDAPQWCNGLARLIQCRDQHRVRNQEGRKCAVDIGEGLVSRSTGKFALRLSQAQFSCPGSWEHETRRGRAAGIGGARCAVAPAGMWAAAQGAGPGSAGKPRGRSCSR